MSKGRECSCLASQCDPLEVPLPRSVRPNITLKYNSEPDSETNKYRNGTNVTFSCPNQYPIGGWVSAFLRMEEQFLRKLSSSTFCRDEYGVCIDGEWMTLLHYGWDKTLPGFCQRKLLLLAVSAVVCKHSALRWGNSTCAVLPFLALSKTI